MASKPPKRNADVFRQERPSPHNVAPRRSGSAADVFRQEPSGPNYGLSATHGEGPHHTAASTLNTRKANLHGLSTIQVQRLLRGAGYKLPADGKMGPRTATAMDAYLKGKPPTQYNAWAQVHFAPPKTVASGAGTVGGLAGKVGDPPKGGGGGGKSKGNGSGALSGLGGLAGLASSLLSQAGGVGTMIPGSTADDVAGAQYDAAINDLQHQIDLNPAQTAQNIHDIQRNYGAALSAQKDAAANDKAANAAGVASVGDAIKAIVSSLGGAANSGSAQTAAEGADATGALAANANAQDYMNSQLGPLLQQEAADQATSEQRRGDAALADLHSQLQGAQQQRGDAAGAAMMDILDKNNTLAQTRFGNRASLLNTIGGLEISGKNATAATIKALTAAGKASAPKSINPATLSGISKQALAQFLDPTTGKVNTAVTQKLGVQGITKQIKNTFLAAGLDLQNPQVAQAMFGVGRSLQAGGATGYVPNPQWFYLG